MEARRISVSLRRDPREIAERHSQANPLTLYCELARGEEVTETLALYAELHTSRTPASSPVATAGPVAMTAASVGPWELDFSAAQMNQTVLPGDDKEYWLVVYATGASDLLLTLATIRLTLAYDNISQVTPAPPEPALIFAFRTIAVAGQSSIVADSSADTLTIAAGDGITLTTNAGTDTLTISSNASGSGDVVGPASATDDALARFNGTTGKLIQSSTATLTDAGLLTVSDASVTGTLTAPHIHGNLAGAVYSHIRNESGGPLAKGTPVYVTGYSVGQTRSLVGRADSASAATMPAIGILDEELANNANGHCVITGIIENLDTSGLAVNAPLYVASGGGLTATAPDVRAQPIAIVERVNVNNGAIIVTPAATNGSLASQSAASVAITGGSIGGLSSLSAGAITASTSATVTASTASTTTTTGALVVTGGVGIGGAINTGADAIINSIRVGQGGFASASTVVFGNGAGASRTGGVNCVFVGQNAGAAGSGNDNTIVGASAMTSSGGTLQSCVFGRSALQSASSANRSSVFGFQAGRYFGVGGTNAVTTLTDSILIGTNARPSTDSQTNIIVIANGATNGAISDGSNTTVIGTSNTTQSRLFGGNALTTGANGQSTQLGQATTASPTPTTSGATVTVAALIPANSIVIGVTTRVTTAITGATSFDIGDGTTANLFGDDVAVTLGTTSNNTIAPTRYETATNVVLTANGGNFTAGAVRLTVHFLTLVAPTS
jgi:hypothetical protein